MAEKKFFVDINLQGSDINNLKADTLDITSNLASANTKRIVYWSGQYYYSDGTSWIALGGSGNLPAGGATGDILAKASGTDYDVEWISNYTSTVQHEVKAGVALTKGQAVYVSSANGTNIIVSKASNASESTSSKTMGLIASSAALNDIIFVITEGLLTGTGGAPLDTSTANAGDPVWLGTNGNLIFGLANKPVAPAHLVFIGIVTRSSATIGEIFVKVQNGFELGELHDVDALNASNNDGLFYNTSNSLWEHKSIATVLGYTPENVANKSTSTSLGTSDTLYPTQNAVKVYTDNLLGNANALVYKGTIDCSTNPDYPTADAGWMYIASVAGKIGGASGTDVEVGDMIICNTDGTVSGNQATVGQYWNVIQKNIVGAVTGPASSVNNTVAVFDGTTGKVIKQGIITDNGTNVGIGNTDPNYKLDVTGEIAIRGGEGADDARMYFLAGDNSNRFTIETDLDSDTQNDILGFRSFNTDNILVLKGDGNVGIGTSTPLSIPNYINLTIGDNAANKTGLLKLRSTYNNGDGAELYQSPTGTTFFNVASNLSGYIIDNQGNMGIGSAINTLSPLSAKLHVNNIGTENSFLVEDSTNPDSSPFVIDANGNVGIGTLTPIAKLDVNGDIKISTIANATIDTDKFLVSDSGAIKYRTGAELLSDIGAVTGPASSVSDNVVFFDGVTGKIIKDSGLTLLGSNTGDETTATIKTKLGITTLSGNNTGDQDLSGYAPLNPRVQTVASSATVTPVSTNDLVTITAQAAGLTLANPTGTFVEGQALMIRIKDNGTARAITFDTNYRAIGITLPTTTVISKTMYLGIIYNSTDAKWDILGLNQQA